MASVIVIGGGLAGLAAAVALGTRGFDVTVIEARNFPGGRAASYPMPGGGEEPELIDNCQHILLRCCTNLLDFYERLGVARHIRFFREVQFLEPGGRLSILRRNGLPAPLHLAVAFLRLPFLDYADKFSIARGLAAIRRERLGRPDLDAIAMSDWLREKRQTRRAVERFWRPILVSAINEEPDQMAARYGFQVMWLGFLSRPEAYEIGVPSAPLSELYSAAALQKAGRVRLELRSTAERFLSGKERIEAVVAGGVTRQADFYVCAVPFERVRDLAPELGLDLTGWRHSPITGIHLWFDRPVTTLPHAALLDRNIQWFFNKREGRYLQLVVSASRELIAMSRAQVIELGLKELGEFLPAARAARLEKAHVVKELRATFSAQPGIEARRPGPATPFANLFLAGDWTRSGWPATMEGAVRSGYLAAEALTAAAGRPSRFLVPDLG